MSVPPKNPNCFNDGEACRIISPKAAVYESGSALGKVLLKIRWSSGRR